MRVAVRQGVLAVVMAICLFLTRDTEMSYVWTFGVFALGVAISSALYEFVAYADSLAGDEVTKRGHVAAD